MSSTTTTTTATSSIGWAFEHCHNIFKKPVDPEMREYLRRNRELSQNKVHSSKARIISLDEHAIAIAIAIAFAEFVTGGTTVRREKLSGI